MQKSLEPQPVRIVRISLAGQPIGKGRPRFVRKTGRAFTPEKTIRFEDRLSLAAQESVGDSPLFDGPLYVRVEAHMQVPVSWSKKKQVAALAGVVKPTGKPDLDNFAKVCDALNGVVWVDDSQIVKLIAEKHYSEHPRFVVTVTNDDLHWFMS